MLSQALGFWALLLWELTARSHAYPRLDEPDAARSAGSAVALSGGDTGAELGQLEGLDSSSSGTRKLKGRFLQITDIHPDPFYEVHTSTDGDHPCHHGKGEAGFYGAEVTDCDSPYSLVNATFKWLKDNLKDEVDFVIWTGDSARHDNDESIPRTRDQVVSQNEFLVKKFLDVWGKPDNYDDDDPLNDFAIPIVPTLGNNDILPHNIFLEGPNVWTRRYLDIWRQFIPEEQRHQFQQGGWFYVEVIPNRLAVVSLNTLYFFTKNAGVDGCAPKSEPGYEHFDWLRIQLELFRERGIKAMVMGHVPPARTESKVSWDETCWQKYSLWMEQYRDVVVGSFYGHMNIDHFIVQDFDDIKKSTRKGAIKAMEASEETFEIEGEKSYLRELREVWNEITTLSTGPATAAKDKNHDEYLEKIRGKFAERYAVSHVAASVIPNFFPTIRVYEYNTTGLEQAFDSMSRRDPRDYPGPSVGSSTSSTADDELEQYLFKASQRDDILKTTSSAEKAKKKHKKHKKHKFKTPDPPSKSAPPGPAYSPQTLSLLGFRQYYANLTYINNQVSLVSDDDIPLFEPIWSIDPDAQDVLDRNEDEELTGSKPKPKAFDFKVEYETRGDKFYKMEDLSVRGYVELARRIGKKRKGDVLESSGSALTEAVFADNRVSPEADARNEDDLDETKKAGKHKKNKKHKKKKRKMNKVWFEFVKRAFVGTMDPEDIEQYFGESIDQLHEDEVPFQCSLEL